jgi:hypothetical protein
LKSPDSSPRRRQKIVIRIGEPELAVLTRKESFERCGRSGKGIAVKGVIGPDTEDTADLNTPKIIVGAGGEIPTASVLSGNNFGVRGRSRMTLDRNGSQKKTENNSEQTLQSR